MKKILILAEQHNRRLLNVTYELIGKAREFGKNLNVFISVAIIGRDTNKNAHFCFSYGADRVYAADQIIDSIVNDLMMVDMLEEIIREYEPDIVLIPATITGKSIGPRIASRLNTGLTADCTDLWMDEETDKLIQQRPAFGGNFLANIICKKTKPQIATVRPNIMQTIEPDFNRRGETVKINFSPANSYRLEIISRIPHTIKTKLHNNVIVSFGRGIETKKNIDLIMELAELLNADIGASRSVVDEGWIDYQHQIGQTGKVVNPRVYLAFGISGAIQHIVGMSTAKVIIAVNKEADAPIFKYAHYKIIANTITILPCFINAIKQKNKILT